MINPNAYYTVQGWMLSELGLKGNALAVYAIIYGFSQDGASEYAGSSRYLCEWLDCSKKTVLTALAYLTEKGYLEKKAVNKNGVTFCNYVAVRPAQKDQPQAGEEITPPGKNLHRGGVKITPGVVKNLHRGGEEITPHNTRDNNRYIIQEDTREDAPAQPAPPAPPVKEEKGPVKRKYGEYKNVLLTDEEYAKLLQLFPLDLPARIDRLSEYMASKGTRYKSHYATIRAWANRDKKQAAPAGRQVGPSGIAVGAGNTLPDIF